MLSKKLRGNTVFPAAFVSTAAFRLIIVDFIQNKMSLFVKKTDLKNKFYVYAVDNKCRCVNIIIVKLIHNIFYWSVTFHL